MWGRQALERLSSHRSSNPWGLGVDPPVRWTAFHLVDIRRLDIYLNNVKCILWGEADDGHYRGKTPPGPAPARADAQHGAHRCFRAPLGSDAAGFVFEEEDGAEVGSCAGATRRQPGPSARASGSSRRSPAAKVPPTYVTGMDALCGPLRWNSPGRSRRPCRPLLERRVRGWRERRCRRHGRHP